MLKFSSRNNSQSTWYLTSSCFLALFFSSNPSNAMRISSSIRQSFLSSLAASRHCSPASFKRLLPRKHCQESVLLTTRSSPTLLQSYFSDDIDDAMTSVASVLPGAVKYEMTKLPDSLIDTTIFVGNLCDFVTDEMLSKLFARVSKLRTVPSAVVRKPNNYSMGYGFVTFPTAEEKEVSPVVCVCSPFHHLMSVALLVVVRTQAATYSCLALFRHQFVESNCYISWIYARRKNNKGRASTSRWATCSCARKVTRLHIGRSQTNSRGKTKYIAKNIQR